MTGSDRRKRIHVALCFFMSFGFAHGTQDAAQGGRDPLGQLARAEATWRESRTDAYEFRFHYACNGLVPQPRGLYPGFLFRVKHGESTLINSAGQPVRMAADAQYSAVERLFDIIRKESTGRPAKLDVRYDPIRAIPHVSASIQLLTFLMLNFSFHSSRGRFLTVGFQKEGTLHFQNLSPLSCPLA